MTEKNTKAGYSLTMVLIVIVLFFAAGFLIANKNVSSPAFVTFDAAKFFNAQRAIASKLLNSEHRETDISTITRVGAQVENAIHKHAAGAIVLVKQSVVTATIPDITNSVLKELGLPTDVPTLEFSSRLNDDVAPTNFTKSNLAKTANSIWQNIERKKINNKSNAESLLP